MGTRMAGKVAIITGAARGLGESMARLFAEEGAAVLVADILDDLGEQVVAEIQQAGGRALYQHLDVSQEDEWARGVERCNGELGRVNVLVSNAMKGGCPVVLGEMPTEHWHASLAVNLNGPFFGIRAVLPTMLEDGGGTIVAISASAGGDASFPIFADYEAAKAATTALVRNVAVAYGQRGIRANAVHPGPMRTPSLIDDGVVELAEAAARGFPLGRIAEPVEVAQVALFLASDESSYVTGTKISADGGSAATILPVEPSA